MKQEKTSMPYAWYWHGKPLRTGLAQGEKIRPVCTGSHILQTSDHYAPGTTGSQSRRSRTQTAALLECNNQDIAVLKANRIRSLGALPQLSSFKTMHTTLSAQSPAL
ncbi:hypothetical protein CNMCM5623_000644 [Aspergillus felis]|uniref:Uncharacterized protein n=1 Tax=Aspergillus felis TaxID=1287682 RepID=A0A8H6QVK1_9EURO|nr:hypothetical protein CNMCM5623_000644 [Aspergillus felis]KAF7179858.1 hypothetical protein CNMCM7691_008910 [Aspergillus felis]